MNIRNLFFVGLAMSACAVVVPQKIQAAQLVVKQRICLRCFCAFWGESDTWCSSRCGQIANSYVQQGACISCACRGAQLTRYGHCGPCAQKLQNIVNAFYPNSQTQGRGSGGSSDHATGLSGQSGNNSGCDYDQQTSSETQSSSSNNNSSSSHKWPAFLADKDTRTNLKWHAVRAGGKLLAEKYVIDPLFKVPVRLKNGWCLLNSEMAAEVADAGLFGFFRGYNFAANRRGLNKQRMLEGAICAGSSALRCYGREQFIQFLQKLTPHSITKIIKEKVGQKWYDRLARTTRIIARLGIDSTITSQARYLSNWSSTNSDLELQLMQTNGKIKWQWRLSPGSFEPPYNANGDPFDEGSVFCHWVKSKLFSRSNNNNGSGISSRSNNNSRSGTDWNNGY